MDQESKTGWQCHGFPDERGDERGDEMDVGVQWDCFCTRVDVEMEGLHARIQRGWMSLALKM